MAAMKNTFETIDSLKYMVYVNINFNVFDLKNSKNSKCSSQFEYECLKDKLKDSNASCVLPFDNEALQESPICSSYVEGLEVVKDKLSKKLSCLDSCLQLSIDFKEEIPNYI